MGMNLNNLNLNNLNLNLRAGDRISVAIPGIGDFTGIFISMSNNLLVWIADLPGGPLGPTVNYTILENANITRL